MSLIKNLFYKTGNFELNIPKWSLPDQGIIALTGASGSGKTTVLKILCGLLPCPKLSWIVQKQDLAQLPAPKRNIGMCFQDLRLFPHQTARQNILFAIKSKGIPVVKKQKQFDEMADFLNLNDCLDLFVENLSGGEKQRIALMRTLIVQHQFLFLDEAFSYLDKSNKEKARSLTTKIAKKYSVPILLVSHDRKDIIDLADKEFCLDQGRIHEKNSKKLSN